MFELRKVTGKISAMFLQSVFSRCACTKRLLLLEFIASLNLQVLSLQTFVSVNHCSHDMFSALLDF